MACTFQIIVRVFIDNLLIFNSHHPRINKRKETAQRIMSAPQAIESVARLKNRRSPNTRGGGPGGRGCDLRREDEGPGLRAAAAAKDGTAVLAVGATRACEATLAIFG